MECDSRLDLGYKEDRWDRGDIWSLMPGTPVIPYLKRETMRGLKKILLFHCLLPRWVLMIFPTFCNLSHTFSHDNFQMWSLVCHCPNQRLLKNIYLFTWRHVGFLAVARELLCSVVLVAQLCPIFCDPMHCSPPGSSVCGILQGKNTRVGLPFSRGDPSLRDLPNPGIEPRSPTLWADSLPTELLGKS